jgi:hypothetical protein
LTSLVLPFPLPSFFLVFSLTHSLCLSVSLSLSLLDGDVTRAPSIDLSRPGTSGVSSEGAPRSADVEEVQEKNIFLKGIRSMKNDDSDIHQRKIQKFINKIVSIFNNRILIFVRLALSLQSHGPAQPLRESRRL